MTLIRALIDTAALRHNLATLRARARGARVTAVVKADAYGHGLTQVARAIESDALAVARLEEGLALRSAGITCPVLLLEGVTDRDSHAQALAAGFELVVHEPRQLALLTQQPPAGSLTVWVKIDTGMNRLGFPPEDLLHVLERLQPLHPRIRLMTHLACADEVQNPLTATQLQRFADATAGLLHERSALASAGLLSDLPTGAGEWVRPGVALYGISPLPHRTAADLGLNPVMTLETQVIALRQVPCGDTVGYGATWRAARDSRVAIIAAGYADGLLRSLPSGTPVLIQGRRAPLAGRISMDMCAVDVTDLPEVTAGDRAVLWGKGLPVEEIARFAGTIPYELVCAVSARVPRVIR